MQTHTFPPVDPVPDDNAGLAVWCIWREAEALSSIPACELAAEAATLEDAREALNDALARVARFHERSRPLPLIERMTH